MTDLPDELHVPDQVSVLSQAIPFDKGRWIPLLPDAAWWPTELDSCPTVGRWPRVDRRTVFTVASAAGTTAGNRRLLVAALVWGTGTKAQSVHRRGKIFANTSPAALDARLDAALAVLHEEGAVQAYRAFNNDQRIPYLGAAFFTKVLYFAGTANTPGPYMPLILDSLVARALADLKAVDLKWPVNGWTTDQYQQYLDAAHNLASRLGVRPDQVEAGLFAHGKQAQ